MDVIKAIMAYCAPLGAIILILASAIHMIAPKWFSRHIQFKNGMLLIGFIIMFIGLLGLFIFGKW